MSFVTSTSFAALPIDPGIVSSLLREDDAGHVPRSVIDDQGGSPLRCCLRPSQPGERLALVAFAPLRRWSAARGVDPGPYDEVGPVFLHAAPCRGRDATTFPDWLRVAPRVFRAYSSSGTILGGTLVDAGGDFESAITQHLADPAVALVHARAVAFGCFTFEVRRN
jgi:Protein of unknown function (DUF1203)